MPSQSLDQALLAKGVQFHEKSRFNEALQIYTTLRSQHPGDHALLHLIGHALMGRGQPGDLGESIQVLKEAISKDSSKATYHNDLGTALWRDNKIEDAASAFREAKRIDPFFVQAAFNLGNFYYAEGDILAALHEFEAVVNIDSSWIRGHFMRGECLTALGRPHEAIDAFSKSTNHPRLAAGARLGRAHALLKVGRWKEGWEAFETRLSSAPLSVYSSSSRMEWCGDMDPACWLLVYAEQGIGDTIMCARFLPEVQKKVGKMTLACDPTLHRLFNRSFPGVQLVPKPTSTHELDEYPFEKRIAMMSLARLLCLSVNSIPGTPPFLEPNETLVNQWRRRVAPDKFKVGIAWRGNPNQKEDLYRSCPPSSFRHLRDIKGVRFYSIQVPTISTEIAQLSLPNVEHLSGDLHDFDDTASLIHTLDLVITVDTAVAHLAGAVGTPVWTLLWTGHCWRYLTNRLDSPWYPSMRLYRQKTLGDWDDVLTRVSNDLNALLYHMGY